MRPVENANVILVGTRLGTVSNKDGGFELNVPVEKKITIKVSHVQFLSKKTTLKLENGEHIDLEIQLFIPTLDEVEIRYKEQGTSPIDSINTIDAASISLPSSNIEGLLPALGFGVSQNNELSAG